MYKNFLSNLDCNTYFDIPPVLLKPINLIKSKIKTNRKIYLPKKSTLSNYSEVELFNITKKLLNSLENGDYRGQYRVRTHNNGLPHLENSFNKFIRYFNSRGSLLKYRAIICKALSQFSKILISKSAKHVKNLSLSGRGQLNFLYYYSGSRNANNLFNWWAEAHNHYFTFKLIKATKQLKKRKNIKNKLTCVKLPVTSRLTYSLKFLNLYSETIGFRKIEDRILQSFINTFLTFGLNPIRTRRAKSYLVALRKPLNNY